MTRQKLIIGAVAAAFALSVTPVWAQGRPNTTGSSSGSAAPRGGEGGGSSSAGSTSSGSGSSGGSSMGSMPGSMGSGGYAPVRERAPQHPNSVERGAGREAPDRATPRGGATAGDRGMYGGAGMNNSAYGPERSGERSAVPAYSRPRNGAPILGEAGPRPRGSVVPGQGGSYYPIYDPYYYYGYYDPYHYGYGYRSSRYWLPGYGFGLGYFGYDPFLFGGYEDPYYYYGQSGSGSYGYGRAEGTGGVRLKVKPQNAQVYVDGYYVGVTDSFDGMFQKLSIEAGPHRIEVRAEGYEPVQFDVMVAPGETVTYKGELNPIR